MHPILALVIFIACLLGATLLVYRVRCADDQVKFTWAGWAQTFKFKHR